MIDVNRCECGSYNLQVTDSRQHDRTIWRTRACRDCGRRMKTIEVDRAEYFRMKRITDAYDEITIRIEGGKNDSTGTNQH